MSGRSRGGEGVGDSGEGERRQLGTKLTPTDTRIQVPGTRWVFRPNIHRAAEMPIKRGIIKKEQGSLSHTTDNPKLV